MIGTALVAATIGLQLVAGALGLQAGLTVLLLAPELYGRCARSVSSFTPAPMQSASERIFAELDAAPVPRPPAHVAAPDPRPGAMITARGPLLLPRARRRAALTASTSPRARPHHRAAGPSGAARARSQGCIMRLADPTRGQISCDGLDLRTIDLDLWRCEIAWVPQRPTLFAGTIAANIACTSPAPGSNGPGAPPALPARDGLHRKRCPAGSGRSSARAPGGCPPDRRSGSGSRAPSSPTARCCSATSPPPTSTTAAPAPSPRRIARLAAGRTTLLIVHEPLLAELADEVYVMHDGRLSPAGRTARARRPARRRTPAGVAVGARRMSRLLVVIRAGRGERARLALQRCAGRARRGGAAIALLSTSGYLISRAAQRPADPDADDGDRRRACVRHRARACCATPNDSPPTTSRCGSSHAYASSSTAASSGSCPAASPGAAATS